MTHDERVRHHMYDTCEGIAEHSERIAKLEELVLLAHRYIAESCAVQYPYPPEPVSYLSQLEIEKRMSELGIEVES